MLNAANRTVWWFLESFFGQTSNTAIEETCVIHGLVGKNV